MALIQEMRRLTFLISESMYEQLSEMSAKSGQTKPDFVRQSLENEIIRREGEELQGAAADLAPLYETDKELVAFNSLDGKDFL